MKHTGTFIVGIVIVLVLLLWMITYQVSFHEAAVVATFGKVSGENAVLRGDSDEAAGVVGNLRFKWPYPIQRVYIYDTRVRVLEARLEEQQTQDNQAIVAAASAAWRIDDPLKFYQNLTSVENAEEQIRTRLREAKSALARYTLSELTNTNPAELKIGEAESRIREKVQQELAQLDAGITLERVGITRLVFPAQVTQNVFESMKANRQRLASAARNEGETAARTITLEAEEQKKLILSFAELRAAELRAEGDQAEAQFAQYFAENEDFAIFLRKLDTYRRSLANNTTFVFDWKMFPEFRNSPGLAPTPGTPGTPVTPDAPADN